MTSVNNKFSNQIFLRWMQDYYANEFLDLSSEFKNEVIKKVLFNNQNYLTKEMVLDVDGCNKCGRCCEGTQCLDFDKETRLCTRHDDPIHEFCINYPWGSDEFGIAPLTINCQYMIRVFVKFFDEYFSRCVNE